MPQGGVDNGENYYKAALRELKEETSIKTVTLVKEIEGFFTYYLPNQLLFCHLLFGYIIFLPWAEAVMSMHFFESPT